MARNLDLLVFEFAKLQSPMELLLHPHVLPYSPHEECNQSRSITLPIFGTLSSVILGTFEPYVRVHQHNSAGLECFFPPVLSSGNHMLSEGSVLKIVCKHHNVIQSHKLFPLH